MPRAASLAPPGLIALAVLALLAILAPDALAQAGGGSSGFGGGGGGGSGGGGFGGSGGGSFDDGTGERGSSSIWSFLIFFAVIALVVFTPRAAKRRRARSHAARDAQVSTASAEAAQDDPAFAAAAVKAHARELYIEIQRAWDARDEERLARMLGPDLLVEWRRRLADFERKGWHNRVQIVAGPEVAYVGLVNREGSEQDRVTVSVAATLHSMVVNRSGATVGMANADTDGDGQIEVREFWTLARSDGEWILVSIEQEAEGEHHLGSEVVAAPWSDDARLADESLVELATADAPPAGTAVSELVSVEFEGTAREKALDLSLADPRCAPYVLEVAARRAVAAWAEAVDGDDAALLQIATPEAVLGWLYPGGAADAKARIVVRGPRLERLVIAELDTAAAAPRMVVEAHVRGRRYVEDRDTLAVLRGDKDHESAFTERWTFELDGDANVPWRLVGGGSAGDH